MPKDAAYEIPLHLEYLFTRRRVLHVFTYISLCKMNLLPDLEHFLCCIHGIY